MWSRDWWHGYELLMHTRFLSLLLPLMLTLAGCGTLPPPTGSIAGIDATKAVVVVASKQTLRMKDGRNFQVPVGIYKGIEDDEDGVYFEAPIPVMIDNH